MAEYEPDPVSYVPGLRLRAVRFIDENTLEYDFEGIDTADETFRMSRSNDNRLGIWVYNFDQDFGARYRAVPGVRAGAGLERLGAYFFAARCSELPVGSSYERLRAEIQAEFARRWYQARPDGPAADSVERLPTPTRTAGNAARQPPPSSANCGTDPPRLRSP